MTQTFNLTQYLNRIQFEGEPTPTLEVLNNILDKHIQNIPFENIDVLLKRPVVVDIDHVFNKIVINRRGGYCFENNTLLLHVLDAIGFNVYPVGGRVYYGKKREEIPARTHMALIVKIAGISYLVDGGFGAASIPQALELTSKKEQSTVQGTRRLDKVENSWFHQIFHKGGWLDLYKFDLDTLYKSDQKVANWFTSTNPDSHFIKDLSVALALTNGGRKTLSNNTLTYYKPDGSKKTQQIPSNELVGVVEREFGIILKDVDTIPVANND